MKLQEGKMDCHQLAEWFGIKYRYYNAHRPEKLKVLKYYCDFDVIHGGVLIKKVYLEEYDKGATKDVDLVLQEISKRPMCSQYENSHIGTNRSIAYTLLPLINATKNEGDKITLDTMARRVGRACSFLFSKRYKKDELILGVIQENNSESGPYGWRRGILLIKEDEEHLRLFTEEEEEKLHEIAVRIYSDSPAEIMELQRFIDEFVTSEAYDDLSIKELKEILKKKNQTFYQLMRTFLEETGLQLVNGTIWIFNEDGQQKVKVVIEE